MPADTPAIITFTITSFNDVSKCAGGYSIATMSLAPGGPTTVSLSADATQLIVTGPATLQFAVFPVPGYLPIGISFQQSAGDPSQSDPVGLRNFPSTSVSFVGGNRYLTVRDLDLGGQVFNYEFDFVIQRAYDRAIGLIDPMITNTNR